MIAEGRQLLTCHRFEALNPGATPLDMQCLKLFAEFLGLTMKGKVRGKVDPKKKPRADTGSVRGAMRRFCNAWKRENHQEIPPEIERSMAPVSKTHRLADAIAAHLQLRY